MGRKAQVKRSPEEKWEIVQEGLPMKPLLLVAFAPLLCPAAALAAPDMKSQLSFTGKPQMDFRRTPKSKLRMDVRSGEIHILLSEADKIPVQLSGKNVDKIQDVRARFTCSGTCPELHITGGPKNELITDHRCFTTLTRTADHHAGRVLERGSYSLCGESWEEHCGRRSQWRTHPSSVSDHKVVQVGIQFP